MPQFSSLLKFAKCDFEPQQQKIYIYVECIYLRELRMYRQSGIQQVLRILILIVLIKDSGTFSVSVDFLRIH